MRLFLLSRELFCLLDLKNLHPLVLLTVESQRVKRYVRTYVLEILYQYTYSMSQKKNAPTHFFSRCASRHLIIHSFQKMNTRPSAYQYIIMYVPVVTMGVYSYVVAYCLHT